MKSNINIINPFLFQNKKDRDYFPLKSKEKKIEKLLKIKSSKSNKFFLISKDDKTNSFSIIHLSSTHFSEKDNLPSLSSPSLLLFPPVGVGKGREVTPAREGGPIGYGPEGREIEGKTLPSLDERKNNEGPITQIIPTLSSIDRKKRGKGQLKIYSNKEIVSLLSLLETNSKFSNQLKGIQFKIAGRLRGAQRARSILLNHGRISTQTFNSSLKFNKKQIFTK